MNEWQVILLLGEAVGLLLLVGAPILKLNSTLTKMSVQMDEQAKQYKENAKSNKEIHEKIQEQLDAHGDTLTDHELRLKLIEKSGE